MPLISPFSLNVIIPITCLLVFNILLSSLGIDFLSYAELTQGDCNYYLLISFSVFKKIFLNALLEDLVDSSLILIAA